MHADPAMPSFAVFLGRFAVACLPVTAFLLALVLLDSFKLVALRRVLAAVLAGMLAALAAWRVNVALDESFSLGLLRLSLFVAPVVEEAAKALWPGWLVRSRRVGFLVDAAILGFAAGTGFALVEQIHYLRTRPDEALPLWIVRGFGTAVMHGGATALFAVVAQGLAGRRGMRRGLYLLPGLALAIVVHALFNLFVLPPALSALVVVAGMPLILALVFRRSERALRAWLGVGFDSDAELLAAMGAGGLGNTRVGAYLRELQRRFPPAVVADLVCLLRLHLELSVRAKGLLMMREAGFAVPPPDDEVRAQFAELRFLERSVGPAGRLALHPVRRWSRRDLWQLHMLEGDGP